jgi:hypothetical protein
MVTYLPIAESRKWSPWGCACCVRAIFVHLGLRERCRRPCGATSMTMAFFGICLLASSNNTAHRRLLVWYSAEQYFAWCVSQYSSGTDEDIRWADRDLGFGISWKNWIHMQVSRWANLQLIAKITDVAAISFVWVARTIFMSSQIFVTL